MNYNSKVIYRRDCLICEISFVKKSRLSYFQFKFGVFWFYSSDNRIWIFISSIGEYLLLLHVWEVTDYFYTDYIKDCHYIHFLNYMTSRFVNVVAPLRLLAYDN